MPLQQLVEYFNDRLEREHNSQHRPFMLQAEAVKGRFGSVQIGTRLLPIREIRNGDRILGYAARTGFEAGQGADLDRATDARQPEDSIINFDRLSRTVHMLNFLPQTHLDELLFLDVDPRHVLGVKADHGAYFEEVIINCGLQTERVVINLPLSREYARFYPLLLKGLQNYQKRGYGLAVSIAEYRADDKAASALIERAMPDFVKLAAPSEAALNNEDELQQIRKLKRLVDAQQGRCILVDVDDKPAADCMTALGFELAQGRYIEQMVAEPSQKPEAADGAVQLKLNRVIAR